MAVATLVNSTIQPYVKEIPLKGIGTTLSWNKTFRWFGFEDVYAVTSRGGTTYTIFVDDNGALREFHHSTDVSQEGAYVVCLLILAFKKDLIQSSGLKQVDFYRVLDMLTCTDRLYDTRAGRSAWFQNWVIPRLRFQIKKLSQVTEQDVLDFVKLFNSIRL